MKPTREAEIDRLLAEYRAYDRNVDIVCAWEFLFREPLKDVGVYFERYPSVPLEGSKDDVTPDFSALYSDDTGLVGEIASFPLNDQGVDCLCDQILRYDRLQQLPDDGGLMKNVRQVDVMLIVSIELGTAAVRRINRERYRDKHHPYKPSAPPIVVQVAFDQDKYVFQRLSDTDNGRFRDADHAAKSLSTWFERNTIPVAPKRFQEIKAERAFMNDPIPELYLATFLWSKVFPVLANGEARIDIVVSELAQQLRAQHGKARARDVEKALRLLKRAGLAEERPKSWAVDWRELSSRGAERELADTIARLSMRPPPRQVIKVGKPGKREIDTTAQGRLF